MGATILWEKITGATIKLQVAIYRNNDLLVPQVKLPMRYYLLDRLGK